MVVTQSDNIFDGDLNFIKMYFYKLETQQVLGPCEPNGKYILIKKMSL